MKSYRVTIQMKATEQYFVMVVPMFQSLDRKLWCDHSNTDTEQYFPLVLFVMPYAVALILSPLMKSFSVTIQMKATEQYFPLVLFVMLYKVDLEFYMKSKN